MKPTRQKRARGQPALHTLVSILGFCLYLYVQTLTDRPLPAFPFLGDANAINTDATLA